VKEDQHVSTDVKRFRFIIQSELGQSVIYVQYLLVVIETFGRLTTVSVDTKLVAVINAEKAEINQTTEEEQEIAANKRLVKGMEE